MKTALYLLLITILIYGCDQNQNGDTNNLDYSQQYENYNKQLEKAAEQSQRVDKMYDRIDVQHERYEKLLNRWEKQAEKFDLILSRWERESLSAK